MKQLSLFIKGIQKGFKDFGHNITVIVNSVLLTIVYFTAVGITSAIAKIAGKRFLDTKLGKESYWEDLNLQKKEIDEYYRQF